MSVIWEVTQALRRGKPVPKLTEGFVAGIEVPAGRRDVLVFDSEVRGFGARRYADGRASYFIKYSINGQQRRLTLGPVRKGNLQKMRRLAEEVKARAKAIAG
jgi:hypothetical protein